MNFGRDRRTLAAVLATTAGLRAHLDTTAASGYVTVQRSNIHVSTASLLRPHLVAAASTPESAGRGENLHTESWLDRIVNNAAVDEPVRRAAE